MMKAEQTSPGLFRGIYSYAEAARLLNVAPQRVKRWADGYVFPLKEGTGQSAPVLQTERHPGVLSFAELFELFFVREYVAFGVHLKCVRATAEALAKTVGPYPFSTAEVLVQGRNLLIEQADGILKRPDIGQLVADFAKAMTHRVEIRQKRVGRISVPEFGEDIYLDKEIRGGEAVVSPHAIPTRIVYALWEKEQDVASVAEYFDLDQKLVSSAIRYEGQWRLAA